MIALANPPCIVPTRQDRIEQLIQVVSASRLNCFHTCRLKFFFRYVLELSRPGALVLFLGKAVHAALQHWSVARWRGEPHDPETIRKAMVAHWATAREEEPVRWDDADEASEQEKAWGLVEMYLRETPILPDEPVEAVEVQVEADLARHGLPTLIGVIDLVRPGGRIVDFKTSATSPQTAQVQHRNETQLTAYGILYRDATGETESGLELHHLVKTKQPKLVVSEFGPITETQQTRLFRSIESYQEGVQREDFVPSPGLHCAGCEFFAECMAWKGGA
ncbi:MAG TPA: PD-(D/E)XK nuclease family protein [Terrimicrobiaceae bacterium]|nr:PD-(D/E)XK nuclease family protein [Terrimicrobiaceae bacterium]